jgi:hypothetical protein
MTRGRICSAGVSTSRGSCPLDSFEEVPRSWRLQSTGHVPDALREVIEVTATQFPSPDGAVQEGEQPTPESGRRATPLLAVVALLVAAALGLGAGWLAFSQDGEAEDATSVERTQPVPAGVHDVVDQFIFALANNDYALLQDVVTVRFRRVFYQGDPDGSPWRDDFAIEAYKFMDDPNVSEADLVFYDVETIGDRIVRGNGPWNVVEAQNWRDRDLSTQYEAVHSIAVVEADGAFKVDDAYWAATSELVPD